jgi:DNA repair photolyase
MIISASRRTDIPAYYAEWFINRINKRYLFVRNPVNPCLVSKINLSPDVIDCIVFWSKNPKPMLNSFSAIKEYSYYFQFTLNPYDNDIEINLPSKKEIITVFKKLSDKISPQKIIWRYDPVLINNKYTIAYHIEKFNWLAYQLKGYTKKVIFSFIDFYKKNSANIKTANIKNPAVEEKNIIAANFSHAAKENSLVIETCAEDIDFSKYNIAHAKCIDDKLIEKITGYTMSLKKDRNQRLLCGCVESIDIGEYNSCLNNCIYCYANYNNRVAENNSKKHNKLSPLLIGNKNPDDKITERKIASNKMLQKTIF